MIISSLDQLQKFAQTLSSCILLGDSFIVSGPLGAGKTTLVQMIAKILKINEPVTSPTYTYIHTYDIVTGSKKGLFAHIDAYRIDDPHLFHSIGISEYIQNPACISFIEWGEKIANHLPCKVAHIKIAPLADGTRELIFLPEASQESRFSKILLSISD